MQVTFEVNGQQREIDVPEDKPLLWILREDLGLTGSKFGCGIAQCGACTVQMNGSPTRSCQVPASALAGQKITTIEGVASPAALAVREAWRELDVVQCGYCQSGQMISATSLLENNPSPSDGDINQALSGNLCRCGTYHRIRAAIHAAAKTLEA